MSDSKSVNILEVHSLDRKANFRNKLISQILSMELLPGTTLDELILSEEFGLSRPPIREMLRQMAAEGYIELEANRAPRVAAMSYHSLRNFYLAAPLIYVATTKLAAQLATAADVKALREIQKHFSEAVFGGNLKDRIYYNDQFHLKIGEISRNDYFMPSLRRLLIDHARLGNVFYQPNNPDMEEELKEAVMHHEQIINAIEIRNDFLASEIIKEHLELSRRNISMYVAPNGMDISIDY